MLGCGWVCGGLAVVLVDMFVCFGFAGLDRFVCYTDGCS